MARKKPAAEPENHERWMVSYADFLTLLFAFFVVMFASSHQDSKKAKAVSQSVQEALESGGISSVKELLVGTSGKKVAGPKLEGGGPTNRDGGGLSSKGDTAVELSASLEYLNRELKSEIDAGKIQVSLQQRGLVVSLREAAFFPSGDDRTYAASYPAIERIAKVISGLHNPVRFEGHTDSVPIHNARFRSNWELSTARSIAIMQLFRERFGLPADRFAVAGYAENMPVDSNASEEGRAHNRRVDVVILSTRAMMADAKDRVQQPNLPGAGKTGAPSNQKPSKNL